MENKINIEEIKDGISEYHREQSILIRLIRMKKGLKSSHFDKLFKGREYKRGLINHPMSGDSFILGVGRNGFTEWAWQLDLLQHMIRVGIVDTKRNEDNEIVYILP